MYFERVEWMDTLGAILATIGFVGFASALAYEAFSYKITGEMFKKTKKIVFPWAIVSFLTFLAGFFALASSRI